MCSRDNQAYSRDSDWLRAGLSGVRIPVAARFSATVSLRNVNLPEGGRTVSLRNVNLPEGGGTVSLRNVNLAEGGGRVSLLNLQTVRLASKLISPPTLEGTATTPQNNSVTLHQ